MTHQTNNNNWHDLIILIQLKPMNKMTIDQFKSLNDNWYSTLTIWICTLCFVLYCWLGEPLTKALAYSNWALHCESQHRSNENAAMNNSSRVLIDWLSSLPSFCSSLSRHFVHFAKCKKLFSLNLITCIKNTLSTHCQTITRWYE